MFKREIFLIVFYFISPGVARPANYYNFFKLYWARSLYVLFFLFFFLFEEQKKYMVVLRNYYIFIFIGFDFFWYCFSWYQQMFFSNIIFIYPGYSFLNTRGRPAAENDKFFEDIVEAGLMCMYMFMFWILANINLSHNLHTIKNRA